METNDNTLNSPSEHLIPHVVSRDVSKQTPKVRTSILSHILYLHKVRVAICSL